MCSAQLADRVDQLGISPGSHSRRRPAVGKRVVSGTGGGLSVLHRTTLAKDIAVPTQDFVFMAFEICEVRLSYDGHGVVPLVRGFTSPRVH